MTLSCNTRGIEALLSGAFFDPQVSCNLVSSWIEPIFDVIDPLVAKNDYETLTIVMRNANSCLLLCGLAHL